MLYHIIFYNKPLLKWKGFGFKNTYGLWIMCDPYGLKLDLWCYEESS